MGLSVVQLDTFRRQPDVLHTSDDLVTIPNTATKYLYCLQVFIVYILL
jgi:hypothetical protein